jgi:hypothetical protein
VFFHVDKNERRRRLLETALELEGLEPEPEPDGASPGTEVLNDPDHNEHIILMSPKAARRFRVRPVD